jgi:hypothetical protein
VFALTYLMKYFDKREFSLLYSNVVHTFKKV